MIRFVNTRVVKIIRNAGTFRVSAGAVEALNEIVALYGLNLSKKSISIVENIGRRTVKVSEIKLDYNTFQ